MRISKPDSISTLNKFPFAEINFTKNKQDTGIESVLEANTSKDNEFLWLTNGCVLEVFSVSTQASLAAYCFGSGSLSQTTYDIFCSREFRSDGFSGILLSVGSTDRDGSQLCLFDIVTSKVIKSIQLPYKVVSIAVVSTGNNASERSILNHHLHVFHGVVAVGTEGGHLALIDLGLDEPSSSDERCPRNVHNFDARTYNVSSDRNSLLSNGYNLCMLINEDYHKNCDEFLYCTPDGSVVQAVDTSNLQITCLDYISQIGSLAVGYSFGCFQLLRLSIPVLEYSSRLEGDLPPVTHFTYQEPENDPRNFNYLWVARGPTLTDTIEDYGASISLFQMSYASREFLRGYGTIYTELHSVCPRLDHELSSDPYNMPTQCATYSGSRVSSFFTVHLDSRISLPHADTSLIEEGVCDLSLCVVVWAASRLDSSLSYHIGIFDLNHWYHAHMPGTLRLDPTNKDVCPFFAFSSLDELSHVSSGSLLAACIRVSSISRFKSASIPAPEQHFYPSSLTYELDCVFESGTVQCRLLGTQRQILADMQRAGPLCLNDPHAFYASCFSAALIGRIHEATPGSGNPYSPVTGISSAVSMQREALLSVVLDYGVTPFILRCVAVWGASSSSSNSHLTGPRMPSLRVLSEWAWRRLTVIKTNIDRLSKPLYDWSGVSLDSQAVAALCFDLSLLKQLVIVYEALIGQSDTPVTEQGRVELYTKLNVCKFIYEYLRVVLWAFHHGVLPENPDEGSSGLDDSGSSLLLSWPLQNITDRVQFCRSHISSISTSIKVNSVVQIDCICDNVGSSLRALWRVDLEGFCYPPSSFHDLFNLFLSDVSSYLKHSIFVYFLLDLLSMQPKNEQQQFADVIVSFSQKLNLSPALYKIVRGLWLIDHQDFTEAVVSLLDPCVRENDLPVWQHVSIIKAMLYQGHHQLALKYASVRHSSLSSAEGRRLRLTLLLANGLTSEALEFQRAYRQDKANTEDFFAHLIAGSLQTRNLYRLLRLPFTDSEEVLLAKQLNNRQKNKSGHDLHSIEILIMHLLQRCRYAEAVQLNNKIRQTTSNESDPALRERAAARNAIVDCYLRTLPSAQRKLVNSGERVKRRGYTSRRQVSRPVPLSTAINFGRHKLVSRSSLVQSVLDKVQQVDELEKWLDELPNAEEQAADSQTELITGSPSEEYQVPGPFIGTPVTPRAKSRHCDVTKSTQKRKENGSNTLSSTLEVPHNLLSQNFNSPLASIHKKLSQSEVQSSLSLLKTPPVKHCKRRRSITMETDASQFTPHSILKSSTNTPDRSLSEASRLHFSTDVGSQKLPHKSLLKRIQELQSQNSPTSPVSYTSPSRTTFQQDSKSLRFNDTDEAFSPDLLEEESVPPSQFLSQDLEQAVDVTEPSPPPTPESFSSTSSRPDNQRVSVEADMEIKSHSFSDSASSVNSTPDSATRYLEGVEPRRSLSSRASEEFSLDVKQEASPVRNLDSSFLATDASSAKRRSVDTFTFVREYLHKGLRSTQGVIEPSSVSKESSQPASPSVYDESLNLELEQSDEEFDLSIVPDTQTSGFHAMVTSEPTEPGSGEIDQDQKLSIKFGDGRSQESKLVSEPPQCQQDSSSAEVVAQPLSITHDEVMDVVECTEITSSQQLSQNLVDQTGNNQEHITCAVPIEHTDYEKTTEFSSFQLKEPSPVKLDNGNDVARITGIDADAESYIDTSKSIFPGTSLEKPVDKDRIEIDNIKIPESNIVLHSVELKIDENRIASVINKDDNKKIELIDNQVQEATLENKIVLEKLEKSSVVTDKKLEKMQENAEKLIDVKDNFFDKMEGLNEIETGPTEIDKHHDYVKCHDKEHFQSIQECDKIDLVQCNKIDLERCDKVNMEHCDKLDLEQCDKVVLEQFNKTTNFAEESCNSDAEIFDNSNIMQEVIKDTSELHQNTDEPTDESDIRLELSDSDSEEKTECVMKGQGHQESEGYQKGQGYLEKLSLEKAQSETKRTNSSVCSKAVEDSVSLTKSVTESDLDTNLQNKQTSDSVTVPEDTRKMLPEIGAVSSYQPTTESSAILSDLPLTSKPVVVLSPMEVSEPLLYTTSACESGPTVAEGEESFTSIKEGVAISSLWRKLFPSKIQLNRPANDCKTDEKSCQILHKKLKTKSNEEPSEKFSSNCKVKSKSVNSVLIISKEPKYNRTNLQIANSSSSVNGTVSVPISSVPSLTSVNDKIKSLYLDSHSPSPNTSNQQSSIVSAVFDSDSIKSKVLDLSINDCERSPQNHLYGSKESLKESINLLIDSMLTTHPSPEFQTVLTRKLSVKNQEPVSSSSNDCTAELIDCKNQTQLVRGGVFTTESDDSDKLLLRPEPVLSSQIVPTSPKPVTSLPSRSRAEKSEPFSKAVTRFQEHLSLSDPVTIVEEQSAPLATVKSRLKRSPHNSPNVNNLEFSKKENKIISNKISSRKPSASVASETTRQTRSSSRLNASMVSEASSPMRSPSRRHRPVPDPLTPTRVTRLSVASGVHTPVQALTPIKTRTPVKTRTPSKMLTPAKSQTPIKTVAKLQSHPVASTSSTEEVDDPDVKLPESTRSSPEKKVLAKHGSFKKKRKPVVKKDILKTVGECDEVKSVASSTSSSSVSTKNTKFRFLSKKNSTSLSTTLAKRAIDIDSANGMPIDDIIVQDNDVVFAFSDPITVYPHKDSSLSVEKSLKVPSSDSFIFSPPLTRSRLTTHTSISADPTPQTSGLALSPLVSQGLSDKLDRPAALLQLTVTQPVKTTSQLSRRTSTRRKNSNKTVTEESSGSTPINFTVEPPEFPNLGPAHRQLRSSTKTRPDSLKQYPSRRKRHQ